VAAGGQTPAMPAWTRMPMAMAAEKPARSKAAERRVAVAK